MPDLYYIPPSPPCRTVLLVGQALGIEFNLKVVDVRNNEQFKPEYLEKNPQHTIPLLDDDGFYLAESRAVSMYLADQYGKEDDDSLYPKDLQKRAVVNQRLFFDSDTLYRAFYNFLWPYAFGDGSKDEGNFAKIGAACEILNTFLEGQEYVAGENLTIADIALCVTVSNLGVCDYDISQHENITRWFEKVKGEIQGYEEINEAGLNQFKEMVDHCLQMRASESVQEPRKPIDLYYDPLCTSCRSTILVAKYLGIDVNLILVDLFADEQYAPDFLEMNPQHTVPTINDNGFHLGRSQPIVIYFAEKYAKDESVYPKDPKKRALVNQRLFFESNTFHKAFVEYLYPQVFSNEPLNEKKFRTLETACKYLDAYLKGHDYVAGDDLTIADIVMCVSVSNLELCEYELDRHENIGPWLERVRDQLPDYEEINLAGLDKFKSMWETLKQQRSENADQ